MLNEKTIAAAIRKVRDRFTGQGIAPSYYEINNGLCDDFALEVAEELGGETDALFSAENGNFQIDGDPIKKGWDWDLLKTHWGINPSHGLTKNQVSAIDFGTHVWLTDGKRHYDAECPEGVADFFELPIFKRYFVQELRASGIACDDVDCPDIEPSPRCPVANPAHSPSQMR